MTTTSGKELLTNNRTNSIIVHQSKHWRKPMESLPVETAIEIKTENLKVLESAKAFTISDQAGYEYVVDIVKKVKDRRKMWSNLIKPVKEAARSAWQKVVDLEK